MSNPWAKKNPVRHYNNCKRWNENNRDRINKRMRNRNKTASHFVNAYKLFFGCVDCGYRENAVALQADHLKDKKYNIGAIVGTGASLIRLYQELLKCEIRCANCHAVKHHYERIFG
jgi:hypothetical protein